ncbi:MAG TPA: DUF4321 domain-containing protein [Symbiobacteriaceae bacterium]|nr:DUF4321 domain-containing protein [Symbiobacteriaceae bacterium]
MGRGWVIFMWTVIGTIVGQLAGAALASHFAALRWLDVFLPLSLSPTSLNLGFITITLGLALKLSIGGAIGLVLSLWLAIRNV